MNFTLKQLRYVEAAGRLGSIAEAARELSISQSSITAAIDALEFGLEYDLFQRTPAKGIQPTPAGIKALEIVRSFLHESKQFEAELQSIGGNTSGIVRIACYATAAPAFLPPILRDLTENFPGMSIQVLEGNMAAVMGFLDDGRADLAFTYDVVTQSTHAFEPLFEAPPYAMISHSDPLSNAASVSFADLAEKPMVLLDLPHTRTYFETLFTRAGCRPTIAHTTRSAEIARALVGGGFGYTILNIRPPAAAEANAQFRCVPISGDVDRPVFGIATAAVARLPTVVTAFIQRCKILKKNGDFDELTVWPTKAQ